MWASGGSPRARKLYTCYVVLPSEVFCHEQPPSKTSTFQHAKIRKPCETFPKNQCLGGPGNGMIFHDFLLIRTASFKIRHHESAIRIAFSCPPHRLPREISLLQKYMLTSNFLQHVELEKRRKLYTYCVFVPSGCAQG